MLTNTLNTNEVKNSAGTEVEFSRLSIADRSTVFAQVSESPAAPHRLAISHQESGAGLAKRRRSLVRIDKTVISTVDNSTPVVISAYVVLDAPVGALVAVTEPTHVLAELISFCASLGASTTILYDGTGNGATVLLTGGL
jgi:cystathionine beta-lyase family protein involved in aluminum resistance